MKDSSLRLAWAAFWVLCFALFGLFMKDVILPRYSEFDELANNPSEYYQVISLLYSKRDLVAQWTVAIGTLLLLGTTLYYNRRSMTHAIESSAEALAETKRSTDNYIAGERGRLEFSGTSTFGDPVHVRFKFINIGRTPLVVTSFDRYAVLGTTGQRTPKAVYAAFTRFRIPIAPGKSFTCFSTEEEPGIMGINPLDTEKSLLMFAVKNTVIFVHYRFRYETVYGKSFERRFCIEYDLSRNGHVVRSDAHLTYEEEIRDLS